MGADAGINAEEEKRVQAYATTSSSVPGGLGGGGSEQLKEPHRGG